MQNVHRYFLYVALLFLLVLSYDVYQALWFTDPATGEKSFGIGVGTLVLASNVSCSPDTRWDVIPCATSSADTSIGCLGAPVRKRMYDCSSCLNRAHMRWAWASLFSVAFADLYVRLCSMGIWTDLRILRPDESRRG